MLNFGLPLSCWLACDSMLLACDGVACWRTLQQGIAVTVATAAAAAGDAAGGCVTGGMWYMTC